MEHLFKLETIIKIGGIIVVVAVWWIALGARLDTFVSQTNGSLNVLERQHKDTLPLLRQICRNTARTDAAQQTCDRVEW